MIPDSSFIEAVEDIHNKNKIKDVEELIIVPQVRDELGKSALPYEDIKLSLNKSINKIGKHHKNF